MAFRELTNDEVNEVNQRLRAIGEERAELQVRLDELYAEGKKLRETLRWGLV